MPLPRLSTRALSVAALLLAASVAAGRAQEPVAPVEVPPPLLRPQGRPTGTAPAPVGARYERERIKRTVPMEPVNLHERWDLLYRTPSPASPLTEARTAYLNWDRDYLYLALESPAAEAVRFDLDCKDDGWMRGADNLSFTVRPSDSASPPTVTAQRFDAVQNRDRPVFAASPIAPSEVKAVAGPTGRDTHAVLIAVPRTEVAGLVRQTGQRFGLRIESGGEAEGDVAALAAKGMLRLALAESVPAAADGVRVDVNLLGPREASPGETVRAVIDIRNDSQSEVEIGPLALGGYASAAPLVPSATFDGTSLKPGQKYSKELRVAVTAGTPFGSLPLLGTAQINGATVGALAAFDFVEPYAVELQIDPRPVRIKPDGSPEADAKRDVVVTVRSRVSARVEADVNVSLPPGWLAEGSPTRRNFTLRGENDLQSFRFRLVPPSNGLANGAQKLEVTGQIAGQTYTAARSVTVGTPGAAPPADGGDNLIH